MARRRRGAGIAGLQKNKAKRNNFSAVGAAANETKMAVMAEQLETFKANLEAFAEKHRRDIKRNPAFRRHFQRMCAEIGVRFWRFADAIVACGMLRSCGLDAFFFCLTSPKLGHPPPLS